MEEVMKRLDRIEQILREMGHCERCSYAHAKGETDCIVSGLVKVERSMDRLLGDMAASKAKLEAVPTPPPTPSPSPKRWWQRRPIWW